MKIEIGPIDLKAMSWCFENARAADVAELTAVGAYHPNYPELLHLRADEGFVVKQDGEAVGWVVACRLWQGVWAAGALATAAAHPRAVAAAVAEWLALRNRLARSEGAHRIHAQSLGSHAAAHRVLIRAGFKRETVLLNWGTKRETFIQFAWVAA